MTSDDEQSEREHEHDGSHQRPRRPQIQYEKKRLVGEPADSSQRDVEGERGHEPENPHACGGAEPHRCDRPPGDPAVSSGDLPLGQVSKQGAGAGVAVLGQRRDGALHDAHERARQLGAQIRKQPPTACLVRGSDVGERPPCHRIGARDEEEQEHAEAVDIADPATPSCRRRSRAPDTAACRPSAWSPTPRWPPRRSRRRSPRARCARPPRA